MSLTSATTVSRPAIRLWPLLIVTLGGSFTGFSGILLRLSEVGPAATGGWRLAIAALIFMPIMLQTEGRASFSRGVPVLLLAGMFFAVDIAFYHWALHLTSVAHATLLTNLAPVVALVAGVFFFAERLNAPKLLGLAAALSGAFLMTGGRIDVGGTLEGNGLAVLSMVGYASYLITVKFVRRSHSTMAIMAWSSLASAACLFMVAWVSGETIIPTSVYGWSVVIGMGLVAHVMGQGLIAFGMREAPVGLGSILLLTQPVVASTGAWVLFNETLGALEVLGAGLVLTGLVLASRARG
ncbi:MAG: DMT family transporter [Alphaproteobacteria bacterium]